ncbi:MAG: hypothetical protein M1829_003118 [Trizodia sp. TS-e1964]|nr:MAG: hypothetical protein M1829_003118 [Trizodia sp. TS-e1964]
MPALREGVDRRNIEIFSRIFELSKVSMKFLAQVAFVCLAALSLATDVPGPPPSENLDPRGIQVRAELYEVFKKAWESSLDVLAKLRNNANKKINLPVRMFIFQTTEEVTGYIALPIYETVPTLEDAFSQGQAIILIAVENTRARTAYDDTFLDTNTGLQPLNNLISLAYAGICIHDLELIVSLGNFLKDRASLLSSKRFRHDPTKPKKLEELDVALWQMMMKLNPYFPPRPEWRTWWATEEIPRRNM